SALRLLVDTDAFCKLGVGGLLDDAVRVLGASLSECGRLPALPHMLARGRLRRVYGPAACDTLIPVAYAIPVAPQGSDAWLDKLARIDAIDPGEAQLFAAAAESGDLVVVSDDKRALRALKDVAGFAAAMTARIVVLDAVLIAICDDLGTDEVRRRLHRLVES